MPDLALAGKLPGRAAAASDRVEVLTVYLDRQVFGIPIEAIQDVLETLPLTRVPRAPAYIAGVSNLRGRIVTSIDLRRRLFHNGIAPADEEGQGMNVVIEQDGELYAIMVDRVGDVIGLAESRMEEPPLTMGTQLCALTRAVHQLDGEIIIVLDAQEVIRG